MLELYGYDQMIAERAEKESNFSLPLISWEFYGESYSLLSSFKKDLESLEKITERWDFDHNYHKEFTQNRSVILVTNPDLKIVYASHNMHKMNGYSVDEVLGKSPKMFQGKDTCMKTSGKIREAVDNRKPFELSILNYKKDKTTYICKIKGFPVFDTKGKLINYIAFEKAA
ncbi:PAS domain-containing protein [Aquimarina sp. 2201CG5-10]|uniref:PAS domain-containing protein n=1 Tax=Aquimarina callyspongiae TaxID=3098150 RepID=UPI002AB494F2|nr:PAS domain-containing protein [Aquimarina sp. 2201CG5-10]MDY8137802.1 PAS domain-containing protein [Aquimarina sp. 2201CG5-10]